MILSLQILQICLFAIILVASLLNIHWTKRGMVSCRDRAFNLGYEIGKLRAKAEIVGLNSGEEEAMDRLDKARKKLFSR